MNSNSGSKAMIWFLLRMMEIEFQVWFQKHDITIVLIRSWIENWQINVLVLQNLTCTVVYQEESSKRSYCFCFCFNLFFWFHLPKLCVYLFNASKLFLIRIWSSLFRLTLEHLQLFWPGMNPYKYKHTSWELRLATVFSKASCSLIIW